MTPSPLTPPDPLSRPPASPARPRGVGVRTLRITLTLAGPVLTRATAAGGYGVDAPVARSREDGKPVLPASLVKGKLRQAWRELSAAGGEPAGWPVEQWLGKEAGEGSWQPGRGRLRLSDFSAESAGTEGRWRYRIAMDDELGSVARQALQVVETPFAPGAEVRFTGRVAFVPRSEEESRQIERALTLGLRWITSLGALRTVGFGRLLEVSVEEETTGRPTPAPAPSALAAAAAGELIDLEICPRAPLLVSRTQPVPNLFEAADALPGAVLRGALATTWNLRLGRAADEPVTAGADPERPELARWFERVRFTHAFPAGKDGGRRPVTPPLSLVRVRSGPGEEIYDVLLLEGPALVAGRAPTFSVDWKSSGDVDELFGWVRPERELRVRTAIDAATRRASDEKLFAQETVLPFKDPAGAERVEIAWFGRADLSRVPEQDRAAVAGQLLELLAGGLTHLGKTKAPATVELAAAGAVADACPRRAAGAATGGPWALTLQTPALLCDPEALRRGAGLREAYAEVWRQLSGSTLELVRFFARQRLAGGAWLHARFQAGKPYQPFLLTEAGSVFLLRPAGGRKTKAAERVEELVAQGLPVPAWARERYAAGGFDGDHWSANPYTPENGYGEVAADLEIHWTRRPAAGQVEPLAGGEES